MPPVNNFPMLDADVAQEGESKIYFIIIDIKSLDQPEKTLELVLQQPVFCPRKSFDSFVF